LPESLQFVIQVLQFALHQFDEARILRLPQLLLHMRPLHLERLDSRRKLPLFRAFG